MTSTFALIKSGNEISTRCPGVNRKFLKTDCPFLRYIPQTSSHFRGGDKYWRVWSRRNADGWEIRRQLTCHPPAEIGMLPFEPHPPQISRDKSGLTHLILVRPPTLSGFRRRLYRRLYAVGCISPTTRGVLAWYHVPLLLLFAASIERHLLRILLFSPFLSQVLLG